MPKQAKKRRDSQSEDQQVEDIMAWGNRKENYYQASEEEYSELSEEEQEAKKIYEHQLEELNDQDLYQIPKGDQSEQEEEEEGQQQQNQLSHAYLTKEIKNTARLGVRVSSEPDGQTKSLLESYIQTYLMSLIALRELTIPYVEYHPILNQLMQMKQDIAKLKTLLDSSTHHEEQEDQEEQEDFDEENEGEEDDEGLDEGEEQGEGEEEEESVPEVDQGLKLYEQARLKHQQAKKLKKEEKRQERQKNQKPMFSKINENEGRLANEKILKNKGLLKKRKKIDRNGRVKLRRKFDKATSKRRAYGHVIRQNPGRQYQGERNIKYGRIASTKLK